MRTNLFILTTAFYVVLLTACHHQPVPHELITIDVETNYPEKELMLQDFADVEYIVLETTDEFINKGIVSGIGQNILAISNGGSDGNLFLYDCKTGKGIRKINRKGQGGEEYNLFTEVILNEDQNEMFVVDYSGQKIMVYDLEGNFLRNFKFAKNSYYNYTFDYDSKHLFTYKGYSPHQESENSGHILISKQDGSIVRELNFPYQEIRTPVYTGMHEKYGEVTVSPFYYLTACGNHEDWYITRPSSDTLYHFQANGSLHPFIVRTPSVQHMNPEIFLFPFMITDRYIFMQTLEKKVNKSRLSYPPSIYLGYDKEEKAIYQCTFYNADYPEKTIPFYSFPKGEVMMHLSLQASELTKAYEEGKLKGKLKEIASTLNEDSNAVIMLIKHRKN